MRQRQGVCRGCARPILAVHYAQIAPVRLPDAIGALEQLWTLAIYPDQQKALATPPTGATIALR